MKILRPILLIGENEKGEIVAVKIKEGDYSLVADEPDSVTGVVDTPTPANEAFDKMMGNPKRELEDILDKYKK